MRKEKGFTLIELLIVIAIIAILAAIAIPQFNKYRLNAMLSNVQGLTKSIANQAASLASSAGQHPACKDSSDFVVEQDGDYLKAYTWDGSKRGSTVCDKVVLYDKRPSWLNATEVKGSSHDNKYLILENNGTVVVFDGYVAVKSNYKVGTNRFFGCKYENGTIDDYGQDSDKEYLCHIE